MKKCQHQAFEVVTQYFKDDCARVVSAKCRLCGEENPKLVEIMQEKEDKTFEAYGNKSPYVWWDEDPSRYYKDIYTKEEAGFFVKRLKG